MNIVICEHKKRIYLPKATAVTHPTILSSDLMILDRIKLCNLPTNFVNNAIIIEEQINNPNTLQISSIVGTETDIVSRIPMT